MLDLMFATYLLSRPPLPSPSFSLTSSDLAHIEVAPLPVQTSSLPSPTISARGALLIDNNSGLVLYSKNPDEPYPIASLTKLMTALLVSEKLDLSARVAVPTSARQGPVLQTKIFGLYVGDTFTVEELLQAMLVSSAGDAAITLSHAIQPSPTEFIKLMNRRARELNLVKTNFADTFGFSPGNVSTPRELAWLLTHLTRNPHLRSILTQREVKICGETKACFHGFTTNLLHNNDSYTVYAAKTGTTVPAGECLAFSFETPRGSRLTLVLLGSKDRWQDARKLLSWLFDSYSI